CAATPVYYGTGYWVFDYW
nr:immunoglobulin heavy chain junction region [Macaca mulatta]MOY29898.1 immunoglobulin heavy chain junction region [Macaca mulatta]